MLNNVVLIGRLTADPELRYTPNGNAVSNFSLAVNRYKDNEADFFDIACWQKTAEAVAENLEKGRLVAVSGELRQERWVADDGQNRSKVKVNAQQVKFLDWGDEKKKADKAEITDDDAPF